MANTMKVDELRTQLSKRGLDTSGTKPTLVRRLESALSKESNQSTVEKKRGRENEDGKNEILKENDNGGDEISALEKFQGMSIQKLRKEASVRGLSAIGTKKELVQRHCDATTAVHGNAREEGEEERQDAVMVEAPKKEKLVTVTKKLSAVLDEWLPDHIKSHYHVLEMANEIYGALLNQPTYNKFHVIQVLEVDGGGSYMVYNRWGRLGMKGQNKLSGPYSCRETAIQEFEQKFLAKTKNYWSNRKDFVFHPNYYTWLDVDCIEKEQVWWSEPAFSNETSQSASKDDVNPTVGKKRGRKNEDEKNEVLTENDNGGDEIIAIEKFQGMDFQKLSKEASVRGLCTSGTKKELVQRLCDATTAVDGIGEGEEERQDGVMIKEPKEKLVTATKKGSAVLDEWLPDHIKSHYHVLEMGNEIYDAMLNQTNVGDNNNKFYVIQLLEVDGGGSYMVYNRWGRVGVKGQHKLFGPYSCRETAIQEFEQKFLAKTKNYWSNRKDFVSHPKYYTWLEMDYSEKEQDQEKPSSACTNIQPRESKLEPRVAKFISLICNISMMRQQMMEIGYNAEKLPLGKLSKSTILKGYDALKRISDVIGQSNRKLLEQLSGEFYTVIPHDFGFKKMREFVIDTPQKLKSKLEMVEALGEIELATKLLSDDVVMQDDPLYAQYEWLHCKLTPVEVDSEEFSMIQKYTKNTHAKTHSNYTVEIVHIFRVSREGEDERFKKFARARNRMLLWHGSRLTNWAGILSQGLRIAPPEAPVTGYMFGKGVYFADMFSKSANYCFSNSGAPTGVLLLSEVALGEMEELLYSNYNADKLPAGKLSTKGVGATEPNMSESQMLDDGVVVPFGKPVQRKTKGSLLYNEYIVYDVNQIRMRYVIQVNFNFKC